MPDHQGLQPPQMQKLLADLAVLARSASNPRSLAGHVARSAAEAMDLAAAGFVLATEGEPDLVINFANHPQSKRPRSGAVLCRWCGSTIFPRERPASQEVRRCHAIFPLLVKDQPAGYLFAIASTKDSFDGSSASCLSLIALTVEGWLERMELRASSQRHLQRMEALRNISLAVTSSLDPQSQMDQLLRSVMRELKADLAALYFLDTSGNQLVMAHQLGAIHRPLWKDLKFRIGEGAAGWIAQHRTPLVIPDVTQDPRWVRPHPTRSEHIVSYLGVPVVAENQLAGVLDVATRSYRRFTEEEVNFLAAVASQAGSALLNAHLLGFLRRLVNNAPDVIFRLSLRPEMALEYVSPAAEALTGYSVSELYADPGILERLLEPEEMEKLGPWLQNTILPEGPVTVSLRHRDGRRLWVEIRTAPVVDRNGTVVAVEGIARDVSSQKLAEEQQAKTLRELERKLDQLQALYQIAKDMTNPSDLDSLVRGTMEHLRRLMRANYVLLYRAEQDPQGQQLLRLMAYTGLDKENLDQFGPWRPGEPSVTGLAAATGRLVVVKDISEFPYQLETRKALEDLGVRSLLGLPLQADGQLLGVVNALWCQPVEIDDEMVALFQTLANLLSTGLRNSQLLEDTVAQARRLAALYEVATAINSRASLSPIFQTALEQVVSLLAADRGEIALIDSDGNTFTVVAEYGEGTLSALGRKIPVHTPLEKRLVEDRVPVVIPDLANCPELGSAAALPLSLGIRAMLIVPIIAGDRVIGTMGIDSMRARQFTGDDVSVAQAIAHQISVALERAHLLEAEREKVSELGVLFALSRELSEISHSVEAVLGTVTKRAVTNLPCTTAMALLAEGDEITLGASYRRRALRTGFHPGDRRPLKAYPTLLRASASPEPYLLTRGQALTPEEKRDLFPATVEHLCILPLRVSDRLLGFLVLGEARSALREPFGPSKLKLARAMADQAASALSRAQLFHRLEESYLQTVLALAKAVEAKDTYTADHAQRIAELAVAVGAEMGLSQQELEDLRYGAILHDVGKLAVPDGILRKAGPLDQEEWAIIRRHPAIGAEILGSVKRLEGTARVVRHHHERFDGRGYPDGLAGEAIPLGSRILAVVDAFIAMTDERVYRAPKSPQEALDELDRNAGTQFDPQVVKVFKRVLRRSSQIPEKSQQSSVLLSN